MTEREINYISMDHNSYKLLCNSCVSNLELFSRATDKHSICQWWQGGLSGRISWQDVSHYLHGAAMFCDESLNLEIQFLQNIVNGFLYGIYHEFDWHEDE